MRKFILCFTLLILFSRQNAEAQCNPSFTVSISGSAAVFTAALIEPRFYHVWNFGDGNNGAGSNPSHSYTLPGTYQVKHFVYDSLGSCHDSTLQSITLNFTPVCHASFYVVTDSTGYTNGIHFYSNSSPAAAQISSYTWRVNNVIVGGNSSQLNAVLSPGSITVCLTITTVTGCTDTYCQTFQVPTPCNLNTDFTYTVNPSNRKQISFTPTISGNAIKYLWNFGDGYSSNQQQPVHTYYSTGTYQVHLLVRDTVSNCADTIHHQLTVQAGPEDSCTASFTYTLNNNGQAQFTANSNQPITSQFWSVFHYGGGDSAMLNTMNPTYQFSDTGTYQVCLTLTTNTGCTQSYCETIYVGHLQGQGRSVISIPAYPNPVSDGPVRFTIYLDRQDEINITVTNLYGKRVSVSRQAGYKGTNQISIPTERLGKGQYIVEISAAYRVNRSIFLKL
jgi:PKD repeat protein